MNSNDITKIDAFFNPSSLAIFGSLREIMGTAFWAIKNLQDFGFSGNIYPINPAAEKYDGVRGLKVYSDICDISGRIDLALILTPPETVPGIVKKCGEKGVKAIIILSEGFAESGEVGAGYQSQAVEFARNADMRIMGPNTFGVVNPSNGLFTIPPYVDNEKLEDGGIAVCSQTGSIGPHQMPLQDWSFPISKMCDIGNKCDVDETDILNYLANDQETKVIAMHLEDVRDGTRFMEAAQRVTKIKPLVVLKAGRSQAGGKAAASHTGSLMGNDKIYDAAFKQTGIIRVNTWREFWEVPRTLVCQPLPKGNRFAVMTFTGGQGILAVDAASDAGLSIAKFTKETDKKLKHVFHRLGSNPVDIGPAISDSRSQSAANPFETIETVSSIFLNDKSVDCATFTCYMGKHLIGLIPMLVDMFDKLSKNSSKAMNVWIYGTCLQSMEEFGRQLQKRNIPYYFDMDIAVKTHGYAAQYAEYRRSNK